MRQGNIRPIFEYLCWLQMKLSRGDVSDFVRGITPALYNLSLTYLSENCGMDLNPYITDGYMLKRITLSKDTRGKEILSNLDAKYRGGYKDNMIIDQFNKLRNFEYIIRNTVSHDIVKIKIAQMESEAKMKRSETMRYFRVIASRMFGISPSDWDCFNRMNDLLVREINSAD